MTILERVASIFPEEAAIPAQFALPGPTDQREYLVDGEIRTWERPAREVLSPVCVRTDGGPQRKLVGSFPLLTEDEALAALQAAARAYDGGRGAWPTMSVEQRIEHIEQFVFRMQETREEVVRLSMWEIGKSRKDSEREFDRTVEYIRDSIAALKDLDRAASRFVIEQGIIAQIRRAPLGVVLCMGPFNYPLNETFTTLMPALLMGNTVVFKPPKHGVLLFRPLLEAFRDAFPAGVVNTVYGEGRRVIPPIMASGEVDVLAFIGTSPVANSLQKQHPKPNRLRSVLGLEAKNPAIILADTDLDLAVRECLLGALSFNGQRCTALKMLFVERSVSEDFLARFCAAVEQLAIGMPWDPDVSITPLPEAGKPESLAAMVEDARQAGGHVVNDGGGAVNATFFYPAVVHPVTPQMRLWREEQFGPVVPIATFTDIEEPVSYVEEANFGQQVSIFGTDADEMARLIEPLVNQVCRVNINSQCQRGPDVFPFTGRKDSAVGTLSVSDALRLFAIRTLVAAKSEPANRALITRIVRERKSHFLSTDFIL